MMTVSSESNSLIESAQDWRKMHLVLQLAFRFERCKPLEPHGNHSRIAVDRKTSKRLPATIVENKARAPPKREDLAAESSAELRKEGGERWQGYCPANVGLPRASSLLKE
jgi:hypothetical protein